MKLLIVILLSLPINILRAEVDALNISKLVVLKRNKPSCDRLGNVYDACHWKAR